MEKPISIAPFLWYQQEQQRPDFTITHGKGRKGIIIRTRPVSLTNRVASFIKSALRGKA
ncbi:hypothetical protein [Candidatus Symbiopectobacterium sp. NZEC135]|uniref:hypothetical protein n=1 Tax=Candidatus Symbiopectobacterium sp. NZEC135 TaxID=2820471 RepID=UPI002225BD5F|nr:hypothetical protein [Candidatus Symbiopectobacterium sp. NZEC135]MCW2479158.1 hypothetical protein [Candidatus Symbiopectobacterium sp. NZEC135]